MLESKDHYKTTILVERQDLAFASRIRGARPYRTGMDGCACQSTVGMNWFWPCKRGATVCLCSGHVGIRGMATHYKSRNRVL